MSARRVDRRSSPRVRVGVMLVAAGFGIAAVCLAVFGTTTKQLQIAVLVGLWAALMAAFVLPGMRRIQPDPGLDQAALDSVRDQLVELSHTQVRDTKDSIAAQTEELRRHDELQQARESAARREADVSLQLAVRREVERTVTDQFGLLRQDVAALRAEVVDKLGGQIELERIETTRVIGSDLEALQREIRRLAATRDSTLDSPWAAEGPAVAQSQPGAAREAMAGHQRAADIVDAEVVGASAQPVPVVPVVPAVPVVAAVPVVQQPSASTEARPPALTPAARPIAAGHPFADLPRLSPVPADLLLPAKSAEAGRRRAQDPDLESPRYIGRRRSAAEIAADDALAQRGRRARPTAPDSNSILGQPPEPDVADPVEPSVEPPRRAPNSGKRRAPGHASD